MTAPPTRPGVEPDAEGHGSIGRGSALVPACPGPAIRRGAIARRSTPVGWAARRRRTRARTLVRAPLAVLGVCLLGRTITDVSTAVFFSTLQSPEAYVHDSAFRQGPITAAYALVEVLLAFSVIGFRSGISRVLVPEEPEPSHALVTASDPQTALFAVLGLETCGPRGAPPSAPRRGG